MRRSGGEAFWGRVSRAGRAGQAWLTSRLTHDYFPQWSERVRAVMYSPLGVLGGAAAVAGLCGLFIHEQGFALFSGVASVIAVGVLWPWLALRGVSGTLHFSQDRGVEGEPVEVVVRLSNAWPWPVWGLALRGGFSEDAAAIMARLSSLPGRKTVLVRWTFVPSRRGVYPFGDPIVTTGFPFGLRLCRRRLSASQRLIVWPRTYAVGPVPMWAGDRQVEGKVSRPPVGTTGDVVGLRPYRRGDSPRRIHWRQTARQDRLIVCELQGSARPAILLVLDSDRRVHEADGPDGSGEWLIRIAASLAKGWLEQGAPVGLMFGDQVFPPASGMAQSRRLLDALAQLPVDSDIPLTQVLASPFLRRLSDGVTVVLTTDRVAFPVSRPCPARLQWAILRTSADCAEDLPPGVRGSQKPWLEFPSRESIPGLLKRGWAEARHGS